MYKAWIVKAAPKPHKLCTCSPAAVRHIAAAHRTGRVRRAARERLGRVTRTPWGKSIRRIAAGCIVAGGDIRKRHRHIPKLAGGAVRRAKEQWHDLIGDPADLRERLASVRVRGLDPTEGIRAVSRTLR
jgi:hypothetical protein